MAPPLETLTRPVTRELTGATTRTRTIISNGSTPDLGRPFLGRTAPYLWAATRLSLAFVFLWAFFDKVFGLGHETIAAHSWLNGGSPTTGFLKGAAGPLAGFYQGLAGSAWVDWVFMIGLLGIGIALALGIGMRLAAASGALLVTLMWSASLPPQDNVFMDNHLIYALVLVGLAIVGAGNTLGLGKWWSRTPLVSRFAWLT